MAYDPFSQRKKIPQFPSVFALQNDPAKMKSGFTSSAGVDPNYANRVLQFNKIIAKPSDTWTPAEREMVMGKPSEKKTYPTGYQNTGVLGSAGIENRFGSGRGTANSYLQQQKDYMRGTAGLSGELATNPLLQSEGFVPGMPEGWTPTGATGPVGPDGVPMPPDLTTGLHDVDHRTANDQNMAQQPTTTHASRVMSDLDELNSIIDSILGVGTGSGGSNPDDVPTEPVGTAPERDMYTPAGERPPGAWNTPFNRTSTANWGTSLDIGRPQGMSEGYYKPRADSTQRYYERAASRNGASATQRRLDRRTRPGAPYASQQ